MDSNTPTRSLSFAVVPAGLILFAALSFLLVRDLGQEIPASAPVSSSPKAESGSKVAVLPNVLLALVVIVIAARAVGAAFAGVGQPHVIG